MRGGVQVWKRGLDGHGLRHATAYALQGGCDAAEVARQVSNQTSTGAEAAVAYGPEGAPTVTRWTVTNDGARADQLDEKTLRAWIDGADPSTGEQRGRANVTPDAHLLYDSTINAPKSYSLAAVLHPELRGELDALMDRITAETVTAWREELSSRRGAGGSQRIDLAQIEIVQLDHERSRSLDPHAHRHLWLNAKARGADGKWANVDSQQVFRHQVLVNARGELAARTDARWRQALAAHGYTLNADGEIAELAHVVEPMSKRAAQITRNKAQFESEWRAAHPGEEPSPRLIESWDRRAWALDRAQKPDDLDEDQWRDQVRREIADIDPAALMHRGPAPVHPGSLATVDRDRLTADALGWTDQRATRSQGRFSEVDLRAGATMAVAQAQLISAPVDQARLIDELTARAMAHVHSLAPAGAQPPADVKSYRLDRVALTRAQITERAAVRAALGDPAPASRDLLARALAVVDGERAVRGEAPLRLDDRQIAAAAAVAGSSPIVVIEGPAGAGKTTMLTLAERALTLQERRVVTVAPTMKAAQVASAEIGADGSSLHALLFQHGYRWRTEPSGTTTWRRLADGDVDEDGSIYHGPRDGSRLSARDVIVCDEAGMVDLDAMAALLTVADEAGASVTLVGDPRQVRPVGHSGAMALVQAQTPDAARVDLEAIHRFRRADDPRETDHEYAQISRELRTAGSPAQARELAQWLTEHDHLTRVDDSAAQVQLMAQTWLTAHGEGKTVALMADDNQTVDQINQAIQAARLDRGQLTADGAALIRDRQAVHVGDYITTRRNHRGDDFSVANREQWRVTDISDDGSLVVSGGLDQRTETLPAAYAVEHVTLGYASTVHGAQGITADHSMTIVSDTTTAAQLYVGMTRGRCSNVAVVAASDDTAAREAVGDAIMRDRADLSDTQLRELVAADVKRAGQATTVGRSDAQGWRERPFGDVLDPQPLYDRVTRERARLIEQVRQDETRRAVLSRRLDVELNPAVAVAERDGATDLTMRTRQRDAIAAQLEDVTDRLDQLAPKLRTAETRTQQLADEIKLRAVMDPDSLRLEQHAREYASIHEPARITDDLRRPFGLAVSLRDEYARLARDREQAKVEQQRAIAQESTVASRAAEARDEAAQARETLRDAQDRYDAEHAAIASDREQVIGGDLRALRDAEDRAASAGFLSRRGAQRAVERARADLAQTWGLPGAGDSDAAWVKGRAAAAADDALNESPARTDLDHARTAAEQAEQRATSANTAESRVRDSIDRSKARIGAIAADQRALTREQRLRSELPENVAEREQRHRYARAKRLTAPAPDRRPSEDQSSDRRHRPAIR